MPEKHIQEDRSNVKPHEKHEGNSKRGLVMSLRHFYIFLSTVQSLLLHSITSSQQGFFDSSSPKHSTLLFTPSKLRSEGSE